MYRTCAHPDCTVRFADREIHHVIEWIHQHGPTDLANMLPLCNEHHHLVHDAGSHLSLHPDRTITLQRPDGTVAFHGSSIDVTPTGLTTPQRPDEPDELMAAPARVAGASPPLHDHPHPHRPQRHPAAAPQRTRSQSTPPPTSRASSTTEPQHRSEPHRGRPPPTPVGRAGLLALAWSRSTRRRILPEADFGIASTNVTLPDLLVARDLLGDEATGCRRPSPPGPA